MPDTATPPEADSPNVLLVNPWIHDFAAYDVWARPMGLMLIGGILRDHGIKTSYIDCLDRFHPELPDVRGRYRHGRGGYHKETIRKPGGLEDIPRRYSRYGIKPEWLRRDLLSMEKPDLVFVTSQMTYWYPGVRETITCIKEVFPSVPLVLGGIYATLFPDHARRTSGADLVFQGPGEKDVLDLVKKFTGFSTSEAYDTSHIDSWPKPAFNLQRNLNHVPIVTSKGCPFSCAYCASGFLNPEFQMRNPEAVVDEILYWHKAFGIRDFAFYDDALLVNHDSHAVPILEGIIRSGADLFFHTPNAIHLREISKDMAELLFRAGFKTLRLGLETTDFDNRTDIDRKVSEKDFIRGASNLLRAGFTKNQVGAYLLAGLPGQRLASIKDSIRTVKKSGIMPVLTFYTPIPHTAMWKSAVASSRYDLEKDPVFSNNSIFPCQKEPFSWEILSDLKKLISRN